MLNFLLLTSVDISLAYADNLVVLAENKQHIQQNLSQEIICLEYGLKINKTKREVMCDDQGPYKKANFSADFK